MRKYGKYEKRTEQPAAKENKVPETKSLLLQTYFTSLMSLVLCVTMFFGTTYAWFTSEVTNTGNEIYIGTLDVELEKLAKVEGVETYVSLSEKDSTTGNNKVQLFDKNIRWEPGYTALETIKITNEGDLTFKYVLNFTDGTLVAPAVTIDANGTENTTQPAQDVVLEIAKNFEVWIYKHQPNETSATIYSFADITKENSGWICIGKLDQILNGIPVLEGLTEAPEKALNEPTTETTVPAEKPSDTYTIALHMMEEAGNTAQDMMLLMGKTLSLNVKLVAYQMIPGADEFTAEVVNAETLDVLNSALSAGGNVVLTTNQLQIESGVTMNGGVFNGNGNTLTFKGLRDNGSSVGVLNTTGGVIKNLTIDGVKAGDGTMNGRAIYITNLTSDLTVSNCTLDGAYSFNLNSATVTDYILRFIGTTFKSWTSYANVVEMADFNNCRFENVLKPQSTTNLINCAFVNSGGTVGLDVSALADGETITMENCTYMGITGMDLIVTNGNGNKVLSGTDADRFVIDSEGLVVLKTSVTE